MKKYILLLFLGITFTLNAQTHIELLVPHVKQYPNRTKWCAVACAECVLKYKNINKNQCAIMDYVRSRDPMTYGEKDFCCEPANVFPHPCDKSVKLGFFKEPISVKKLLMHFGNIATDAVIDAINTYNIENDLIKDHPPIAQWSLWDGSGEAHAIVICGIKEGGMVQYMDPNEDKILWDSWNQVFSNSAHFWSGTLRCKECTRDYHCHCYNDELDGDEDGIDCGGADCPSCPPSPPACSNCKLDSGENAIDCGGSCTPCKYVGDVTDELMITNTAQLRWEMMALKKITAKDATTVASGKDVSFITKNTGSIILLPGFTAEQGCIFTTQMKDLSQYERFCGGICHDYTLPPALTVPPEYLQIYNLLYAIEFRCDIYKRSGEYIYI